MSGGLTVSELDERIAIVRQNIRDLVEQAAARSGGADEEVVSVQIEDQEKELARLMALRDALKPA